MDKGKNIKGQGVENSSLDDPDNLTWSQPDLLADYKSAAEQEMKAPAGENNLLKPKMRIKAKEAANKRRLRNSNYDVGFCKPPVEGRFKPGQSGNVKGRPRKKREQSPIPEMWEQRFEQTFLAECYRKISIRDGEKTIKIPTIEAMVKRVSLDALRGNNRAQKYFLDTARKIESENYHKNMESVQEMIGLKIRLDEEIVNYKKQKMTPPEMTPHPNNIIIDFDKGTAEMIGPFTKEEKAKFRAVHRLIQDLECVIEEEEKALEEDEKNEQKRRNLEKSRGTLEELRRKFPKVVKWIKNGAL